MRTGIARGDLVGSLAASDWVGRLPDESLRHFRARMEVSRLQARNARDRQRIAERTRRIEELRAQL